MREDVRGVVVDEGVCGWCGANVYLTLVQVSGSQKQRDKEAAAEIMRQKQAKGTSLIFPSSPLPLSDPHSPPITRGTSPVIGLAWCEFILTR